MRPMLLGDVVVAARALRAVPAENRPMLLARLVREASAAEKHGQSTARNHPLHGDGSLMSAALGHPCAAEPSLDDGDFRSCLALVLAAVG
jgi:hypothetical protein